MTPRTALALQWLLALSTMACVSITAHGEAARLIFQFATPTYPLSDQTLALRVSLSADVVEGAMYARSSWVDEVVWTVANEGGPEMPCQVSYTAKIDDRIERNRGRHNKDIWMAEGLVRIAPLRTGINNLCATYRDLKFCQSIKIVDGDEDLQAKKLRLTRDASRPNIPWQELKVIQMERLALAPGSSMILRELADRGWGKASLDEVVGWYSQSIEADRALMKQLSNSADIGERRYFENEKWRYEKNERVVAAIIELLPNFYAHLGKVSIGVNDFDQTVDLIEWPSKRVLCSIDIGARISDENAEQDVDTPRQEP